jgi:succinoglycan biosynthesis transport protein ExoP
MLSLPGTATPTHEGGLTDLGAFTRTLVRRMKPMLAIFFGFVALVIALSLIIPKSYETTIKIIIGSSGTGQINTTGAGVTGTGSSPNSELPVLNALLIASGVQTAETYVELFKEEPVAQDVIRNLNLRMSPSYLLQKVDVSPVPNTNIISLAVTWNNAEASAAIANAFGNAVVDRERDLVASQADQAISFLQQQMPQASSTMHSTEAALAQYEASHHIADINAQTQSTINAISDIDAKIGTAQSDAKVQAAILASDRAQMAHTPATVTGAETVAQNPVLAQLENQLSQVEVQLNNDEKTYTDAYPDVVALRQQRSTLEREIAAQKSTIVASTNTIPNPIFTQLQQQAATASGNIASDQAQLRALNVQRHQMDPILASLPAQAAALADLQRAAQSAQAVYNALQQSYDNATIAKDTALSDVTVTQPADPRMAKVRPDLLVNTALGIVLGAILAVLGALAIDYFDNTVKDDRDVQSELELPQLSAIPLVKMRNGTPELPWVRSLSVEAFLQLVTSMKYASDTALESLVVTSPSQGDGKSTIALNVAIAMAELEPRVLLVDADLRRASLHAKLRMKNERGLSDILVGRSAVTDAVQQTSYPGLDILTSGTTAPNPIKLLQSPRMDQFLNEARGHYRCTVIDCTALSVNLDSAVVARKADGTVLVLAAAQTDLRAAKGAMRRLQQVGVHNILGYVLNRVVPRREDFMAYEPELPGATLSEEPVITAS